MKHSPGATAFHFIASHSALYALVLLLLFT